MKKFLAIVLCIMVTLSGCGSKSRTQAEASNIKESTIASEEMGDESGYEFKPDFASLDDKDLLRYVKDNVYNEVVSQLNSDKYYVENVDATYVSKEYLEELSYNSKSNIFFGYTLADIEGLYGSSKYVFTVDENGNTVVAPFEDYDDTYEQVVKNVVIGTGVILICVTVSAVTAGAGAPVVSLIFATSAKTGTVMALSSATIGGVASGVVTGIETGDINKAIKKGALSASQDFKWGAISGAVAGGAAETAKYANAMKELRGADIYLTKQQAAYIQMKTGYPTDVISQFHTMDEYKVFEDAHLKNAFVNGKNALIRSDIDLNIKDESGATNLERMMNGRPPLDINGNSYELHHIGQEADGTLAVLTQSEHDNTALHEFKKITEIDRGVFATQRRNFWKAMAEIYKEGAT